MVIFTSAKAYFCRGFPHSCVAHPLGRRDLHEYPISAEILLVQTIGQQLLDLWIFPTSNTNIFGKIMIKQHVLGIQRFPSIWSDRA